MAWTTPATWTAGQLVTAGDFNQQIRDNLAILKTSISDDGATWSGSVVSSSVIVANTGLQLRDVPGTHYLTVQPGSTLSANRTLNITTGDADRTITLSGSPTLGDWFDQAVKAASSPTFAAATIGGAIGLAATPTDGLVLQNTTAATSLVPVQMSARIKLAGSAWNTVAAASQAAYWTIDVLPVSDGPAITSKLRFGSSINGASVSYGFTVTSSGAGVFNSSLTASSVISATVVAPVENIAIRSYSGRNSIGVQDLAGFLDRVVIISADASAVTSSLVVAPTGTTTSKHLGVGGVVSSAWSTGMALEVGTAGSGLWSASTNIYLTGNYYYASGDKFAGTGFALYAGVIVADGSYRWYVSSASGTAGNAATMSEVMRLYQTGGLVLGAPTGGDKGAGTLNAKAVYDDNTLLTDWVFDLAYTGHSADAPAGGRLYGFAETMAMTRDERRLPWMPSRAEFDGGGRGLGSMVSRLWQGQEQQQLYLGDHEQRIAALENCR